jgi:DNA-binding MarR family transcriptional regulator
VDLFDFHGGLPFVAFATNIAPTSSRLDPDQIVSVATFYDPTGAEPVMRLDDFFPYKLAVAAEAVSHALSQVYGKDFGLSRDEWRILAALDGTGPLSSVEIARRTTLDKVQVCRAAARLEERRLIWRDMAEDDKRLRLFACTDDGKALFAQAFPAVNARAEEILALLDPVQRAGLDQVLSVLMATAGQIAIDAPCPAD